MNLLDNLETNVEPVENVENVEGVETETETEGKVLEKTDGGEDWLNAYKEKFGDEWSEKHENLIKKFTRDGKLDEVELLKAHRNLEKSFSEKRQAPEKYEITYAEDVADFKIDENDELYGEFLTKAKEMNLLNDQVNGILNLLASHVKKSNEVLQQEQVSSQEELKQKAEELKKSIPDFNRRATEIKNFLTSKLDKEEYEAFAGSITSEKHMRAIEKLMEMNRDPVVPTHNNTYSSKQSVADQIGELRSKIEEARRNGDRSKEISLNKQLETIYDKLYPS